MPRAANTPQPAPEDPFTRLSLAELNAQAPLGDVLFDYDEAVLSEAARTTLARNAGWLREHTSIRARVEGHADERGTNEYNLALGEQRATAVRTYLIALAIDPSRLDTLSKGEEQPFCAAHEEDCWLANRRAHFIITAK